MANRKHNGSGDQQRQRNAKRHDAPNYANQAAPDANDQPNHHEVALRAYGFWEERGCPEGSPEEDWFRAARQNRD